MELKTPKVRFHIPYAFKYTLMCESDVYTGIVIGAVGGGIAGLVVWLAGIIRVAVLQGKHKRRVYAWLQNNTHPSHNAQWRTTRTIASFNNITEDRVRFICSIHKEIVLDISTENRDIELWGVRDRVRPS